MSSGELSILTDLSTAEVRDLLNGSMSITITLARKLANSIGGTPEFWMARDAQYRDDIERGEADAWSSQLPIKQMAELGWIAKPANWHDKISSCLEFFSVPNVASFEKQYGRVIEHSHLRTFPTYEIDRIAAAAWFRAGEIATAQISKVEAYNASTFERNLEAARRLTLQKQPERFLPRLIQLCADSGVLFALVRTPDKVPISGSARLYQGHPLIQISGRFLTDDQLWFSFYHEAAHVLLHSLQSPIVDIITPDETNNSRREREANALAQQLLLQNHTFAPGPYSHDAVLKTSVKLGIAPGIVVGQLQHAGLVPPSHLNKLKRYYKWNGSSLEMAHKP